MSNFVNSPISVCLVAILTTYFLHKGLNFKLEKYHSVKGGEKNPYQYLLKSNDRQLKGRTLYSLGIMHLYGSGDESIRQDFDKGVSYLRNSSDLGNVDAQHILSSISSAIADEYKQSHRILQGKAIISDIFASSSGSILASMSLGYRHYYGINTPQNCLAAKRFYRVAAAKAINLLNPIQIGEERSFRFKLSDETVLQSVNSFQEDNQIEYMKDVAEKEEDMKSLLRAVNLLQSGSYGDNKETSRAHQILLKMAQKKDVTSMAYLGHIFSYGFGVNKNYEKALEYYRKAVAKDNPHAQNGLGLLYLNGIGVKKNKERALELFLKAAKHGHIDGVYNSGLLIEKENPHQAVEYYKIAAKAGHIKALYRLGYAYEHGFISNPSCSLAVQYFKIVAEMSSLSENMFKEAFQKFQQGEYCASYLIYLQLAEEGSEVAQFNVGYLIDKELVKGSKTTMVMYYSRSSRQGNPESRLRLGDFYYYLKDKQIGYASALREYSIAANMNNAQAMFNLGYMHEYGLGTDRNTTIAKNFYGLASKNDARAIYPVTLAMCRIWIQEIVHILHQKFHFNL